MGGAAKSQTKLYFQLFNENEEALTDLIPIDIHENKSAGVKRYIQSASKTLPARKKLNPQMLLIGLTLVGILGMVGFVLFERTIQNSSHQVTLEESQSGE